MNKNKKQQAQKFVCLAFLIQDAIDELKPTNPKVLKFKEDITVFVELLIDEVKDTHEMQKGTYYNILSSKIDTLIRKNFVDN